MARKIGKFWQKRKKEMELVKEEPKTPRDIEAIKVEHQALASAAGVKEYEVRRIKQDLENIYARMNQVNQEAFDRLERDRKAQAETPKEPA